MAAEIIEQVTTNDWTVTVEKPSVPLLGLTYEVRLTRPDGRSVVMSRDDDRAASVEDMNAAAFAIAVVLDPEHNGPWM